MRRRLELPKAARERKKLGEIKTELGVVALGLLALKPQRVGLV